MSFLTNEQREKFFAMRGIMDKVVAAIPVADEAAFNAAAAEINANAAAIRVWLPGTSDKPRAYARTDIRLDPADGCPYWAMVAHTSYAGQELQPSLTPTIWAHCHGTTPDTARPFVAEGHNPYMKGHYCTENGVVKRCNTDNTVHAPSVYPAAWDDVDV